MNLNEDEIEKLETKLRILQICCDILELGYRYTEGKTVVTDLYAIYEGYSTLCELDILESVLQPILGDGFIESNFSKIELLRELGVKVPIDLCVSEAEEPSGYVILISDENYKKLMKYDLATDDFIDYAEAEFAKTICCCDSNLEEVQILVNCDGMYIIYPEKYFDPLDSLAIFVDITKRVIEMVKGYEAEHTKLEVA